LIIFELNGSNHWKIIRPKGKVDEKQEKSPITDDFSCFSFSGIDCVDF
jgi:hypothetical protein